MKRQTPRPVPGEASFAGTAEAFHAAGRLTGLAVIRWVD